ncbi:MAG: ribonuclease HI [Desulfobacteraceae bacterium]|nr:ribonuclease HI [Desulfobacteraceae bacterium]
MNDYKTHENQLWQRMSFKGNKVWVALNDDKSFLEKENKLLIKYGLKQDYEYLIKKENIKPVTQAIPKEKRIKKEKNVKKQKKITPDKNIINIYTDGASSGNPGPSGIGVYMIYNEKTREISEFIGNATNNIAELKAIKRALEELKKFDIPVNIYTDSNYSLGVLTKNWKAQANKELIMETKKLLSKFTDIKIIKVKGHAGILENEIADRLATSAIK